MTPTRAQSSLSRTVHRIDQAAGLLLLAVTLLTFVSAVMRYLFTLPIPDAFDMSRLLLAATICWGLATTTYRNQHIQVDLVFMTLPARVQRVLAVAGSILTAGVLAAFAWLLGIKALKVYSSAETTFDLQLVVWPFYAVAWMGALATVVAAAARLWAVLHERPERPGQ